MKNLKHLLAITITLLPSAVLADQFTPQQMIDVMTKSPSNRDVRVHDLIKLSAGVNYNPSIANDNGNDEINFFAK